MNHKLEDIIKLQASELSFDACGFASISNLLETASIIDKWLNNGYAGNMNYMHNHKDKRTNPTLLMDGAKSIIVTLLNYFPPEIQNPSDPQIAYYAYGDDYHYVIKSKLRSIVETIESIHPDSKNMVCCDTVPLLERHWAEKAGLGWIGKSGMLINKDIGSFTFIGCIVTSLKLNTNNTLPAENLCGNCTRCIDACPTHAILQDKTIDARRCISYNTIENRHAIDPELELLFGNRLYGCDECLKACPWNKNTKPNKIEELQPTDGLLSLDWSTFSRSIHKNLLRNSAMQRVSYQKMRERLKFINENPNL